MRGIVGKRQLGPDKKKTFFAPSIARTSEPHNWQAAKLRSVGDALSGLRSAAAAMCFQLETWPELRKRYLHRRRAEQRRHEVSSAQKGNASSEHTSLEGLRKGHGKGWAAKGHRKGHRKGQATGLFSDAAMEECQVSCAVRRGAAPRGEGNPPTQKIVSTASWGASPRRWFFSWSRKFGNGELRSAAGLRSSLGRLPTVPLRWRPTPRGSLRGRVAAICRETF